MIIAEYEQMVLKTLLENKLLGLDFNHFISSLKIKKYDYTVVGYFLDWDYPGVNFTQRVFDTPNVHGKLNDIDLGFILFAENETLTLACFSSTSAPQLDFHIINL